MKCASVTTTPTRPLITRRQQEPPARFRTAKLLGLGFLLLVLLLVGGLRLFRRRIRFPCFRRWLLPWCIFVRRRLVLVSRRTIFVRRRLILPWRRLIFAR